MTATPSKQASKQEASSPLRSYSSVAASSRPITTNTNNNPDSTSTSKSQVKEESTKSNETPVTKRKPSRSNIPKPISTSAANSRSKTSLSPSTASSNKESPVTPINAAPSQSLDPSLVTAFVEPTSDALHAARARKPSVSSKDASRLPYRGSNVSGRKQSESSRDEDQSKRNSGEWRSRIRQQTGMDFAANLSNATASGTGILDRGSQGDQSDLKDLESRGDIVQGSTESQTHRGLKRSLSPLIPLATSFAEEMRGNRSRSGSFQSIQHPTQQGLGSSRQLVPSSSRTDFSGSSFNARLHRVSSEVTLDRLGLGGNDGEDIDSSPPSTPSHLSGTQKLGPQSSSGSDALVLTSRPRATTIASLGGTALPPTESIRRARAGTLFNPIGSMSSLSLHSLVEGVSTAELESSSSYGTTRYQRALLQADDAARRSRSGSTGEDSTSSSYSQGRSLGDGVLQESEDGYIESSLGRALSSNNRSLSSLRSSIERSRDSPDTSHDDHSMTHSWRRKDLGVEDEQGSLINDSKSNRPRSMTSSLQPKSSGVYLPPALRHRTLTASGSFLSAPTSAREQDVFSIQLSDVNGNEYGIENGLQRSYSAPRRQTISTANQTDRDRLSISRASYNSGKEDGNGGGSSGRSSRLDYNDENLISEVQNSPNRIRSNTTSREAFQPTSLRSVQFSGLQRTRSNTSPRFASTDGSSNVIERSSNARQARVSSPILPTCDLCAAQVKSLVTLLPCRHQACAACCSTGVSQTAACPSRQHLCAACQEPVESIELSIPGQNGDKAPSATSQGKPKLPSTSSTPGKASPSSLKSPSLFSGRNQEASKRAEHHAGTSYGMVELEGEALQKARDNIVVVRMDNIPWELCYTDVEQWVPEGTLASEVSACPVHITIELMTGKTNNTCFLECADLAAAQKLIRSRNNAPLLGRAVTLYTTTRKELLSDVLHEFLEKGTETLGPCKFGRREMNGIQTLLNSGGSLLKGTVKPLEFFTSIVGLLPEVDGGLTAEQGRVLFETTKDIISLLEERVNDPGHLRDSIRRLVETASRSEALTPLQRLALCAQGENIFKERIISKSYKNSLFATLCPPDEPNGSPNIALNFGLPSAQIQSPEVATQLAASYFSPAVSQSPISPTTTLSSLGAQTPGGAFGIQQFSPPAAYPYDQGRHDAHFYSLMTSPAQAASPRHLESFYPFQPSSPTCGSRSPPSLSKSNSYRGRGVSVESSMGGNFFYASPLPSQPGLGLYQPMGVPQDPSQYPLSFGASSGLPPPSSYYEGYVDRRQLPTSLPAWNHSIPPPPFAPMEFPPSSSFMNHYEGSYSPQEQFQGGLSYESMASNPNHQRYLSNLPSSPPRLGQNYHHSMHQAHSNQDAGNLNHHQQQSLNNEEWNGQTSAQIQADLNHLNSMIASLQQKKNILSGSQGGTPY